MLPTMPSAGRCCWIAAVKVMPLYVAVASTSTGQPGLMSPGVHVKRKDVMFFGRAAIGRDHCVQKERP